MTSPPLSSSIVGILTVIPVCLGVRMRMRSSCCCSGGHMMLIGGGPVVWLVSWGVDSVLAVILSKVVVIHCLYGFMLGVCILNVFSDNS